MNDKLDGVFDNESTWCREAYRDGDKVWSMSADVLLQKGVVLPFRTSPWGTYPDIKPKELAA